MTITNQRFRHTLEHVYCFEDIIPPERSFSPGNYDFTSVIVIVPNQAHTWQVMSVEKFMQGRRASLCLLMFTIPRTPVCWVYMLTAMLLGVVFLR